MRMMHFSEYFVPTNFFTLREIEQFKTLSRINAK